MSSRIRTVVAAILGLLIAHKLFAQGTVLFNNTPSTLVYFGVPGQGLLSGTPGSWYFGLLISPSGAEGTFTFTGNYATNAAVPGRFIGGTQIVNGWAPGTTMYYEVAGWPASMGPTFPPGLLNYPLGVPFGISSEANGAAGGGTGPTPPAPPFPLFGGTGIDQGFSIVVLVPEPNTAALIGLGAGVILLRSRFVRLRQYSDGATGTETVGRESGRRADFALSPVSLRQVEREAESPRCAGGRHGCKRLDILKGERGQPEASPLRIGLTWAGGVNMHFMRS